MQRVIYMAFGSGLIFMILATLIKSNLGNQEKEFIVKQKDTQYVDVFRGDIVRHEQSKENMTEPQSKVTFSERI